MKLEGKQHLRLLHSFSACVCQPPQAARQTSTPPPPLLSAVPHLQQEGGPNSCSSTAVAAVRASIDAHLVSSSATTESGLPPRSSECTSGRSSCDGHSAAASAAVAGGGGDGTHSFRRCSTNTNQAADLMSIPEASYPESSPPVLEFGEDAVHTHHRGALSSSQQTASMRSGSWRVADPHPLRRSSSDSSFPDSSQPPLTAALHTTTPDPNSPQTAPPQHSTRVMDDALADLVLRFPTVGLPWQQYGRPSSTSEPSSTAGSSPTVSHVTMHMEPRATPVAVPQGATSTTQGEQCRSTPPALQPLQPAQHDATPFVSPFAVNNTPPTPAQPHRLQSSSLHPPTQPYGLPKSPASAMWDAHKDPHTTHPTPSITTGTGSCDCSGDTISMSTPITASSTTTQQQQQGQLLQYPSFLTAGPLSNAASTVSPTGPLGSRRRSAGSGPSFERHSISNLPPGFARVGYSPSLSSPRTSIHDRTSSPYSDTSEPQMFVDSRRTAPAMGRHHELPEALTDGLLICMGGPGSVQSRFSRIDRHGSSNRAASESQVLLHAGVFQRLVGGNCGFVRGAASSRSDQPVITSISAVHVGAEAKVVTSQLDGSVGAV